MRRARWSEATLRERDAERLLQALPEARLHGFAPRVPEAAIRFGDVGAHPVAVLVQVKGGQLLDGLQPILDRLLMNEKPFRRFLLACRQRPDRKYGFP